MLAYALLLLRKKASELLYDQNSGSISPVRTRKSVHSSVGKRHSSVTSIPTSSRSPRTNTISSSDKIIHSSHSSRVKTRYSRANLKRVLQS
uniref:Uncharacterized protein n=1 Tax=Ditylenchus dipsaci TaxID=166011 RepID=A0A915EBK8_9BILA